MEATIAPQGCLTNAHGEIALLRTAVVSEARVPLGHSTAKFTASCGLRS